MTKQAVFLIFGRAAQALFGLLALKLAMILLTPSELGKFFLYVSLASFISSAFIGPVGQYSNTLVYQWKKVGVLGENMGKTLFTFFLIAFFSAIGLSCLSTLLFDHEVQYFQMFLLLLAGALGNSLGGFLSNTFNLLGNYKKFVTFNTLIFFFAVTFSVVAVLLYGKTGEIWYWGRAFGQFLMSTVLIFVFFSLFSIKRQGVKSSTFWRDLSSFAPPLIITFIFAWGQNEGYKFLVENFFGLEFLGVMLAGFAISTRICSIFETLGQQLFLPQLYREAAVSENAKELEWEKYFNRMLIVSLVAISFIIALHKELLELLGDSRYRSTYPYIILGAFMELTRINIASLNQLYFVRKKTKSLMLPTFFSSLLMLIILGASFLMKSEVGISSQAIVIGSISLSLVSSFVIFYKYLFKGKGPGFNVRLLLKTLILLSPLALFFYSTLSEIVLVSILKVTIVGAYTVLIGFYSIKSLKQTGSQAGG